MSCKPYKYFSEEEKTRGKREKGKEAKFRKRSTPEGRIILNLQRRKFAAKQKGLAFSIEISDLLPLPTHCPVLGIELDYGEKQTLSDASPSIDRIDNSEGYVIGNVIIVSNRVNRIKSNAAIKELQAVVDFYRNNGAN